MHKKKSLGFLKFVFLLSFMLFGVTYSTNCKAVDFTYCQLTYDDVVTLFNKLNINTNYNYWSGDVAISNFVTSFNAWARTMAVQDGFSWDDYDIIFTRLNSGSNIYWVLNSCRVGTWPDFILNPLNKTHVNSSSPSFSNVSGWSSWTYDSNNIVNGFNKKTILNYQMNPLATYPSVTLNSISNTWQIPVAFSGENITSLTPTSLSTVYEVYTPTLIVWEPHYYKFGYTEIYGNNTLDGLGYKTFRLTNLLQTTPITPTPQPTTPSGGGGGGDSVDLTQTNSLISNIDDTLTEVPDSGDFNNISSGDITNSLNFNETVDPYENFWGSLISGLSSALTSDNVTSYDIDFLGNTYTIASSSWAIDYPTPIKVLLTISSTIGIVIAELKLWRKIVIMINSGNVITLANNFSKDDISDLF